MNNNNKGDIRATNWNDPNDPYLPLNEYFEKLLSLSFVVCIFLQPLVGNFSLHVVTSQW
jgi:hypothetical protein